MKSLNDVREFISVCDKEIKELKNSRADKTILLNYYSKLNSLLSKLNKKKDKTSDASELMELKALITDVDSLLFIVSSMLDYYDESVQDK